MLIRPIGGRWNPRIDFEAVDRVAPSLAPDLMTAAIGAGDRFLAAAAASASRDPDHGCAVLRDGTATAGVPFVDDLRGLLPLVR